ncbi:MAG: AAA family ATPase [Candidatus Sumerlaeota bacterium]|nr:AAA family ATPase [Candidatus Sumerlaeota bacterium]
MKISRIYLEKFKRIDKLEIRVINGLTEDIADQFLLLGDNGTGKTTVLQAVALCLSKASGSIKSVSDFDWLGWTPGRYEEWGTPLIELEIWFSEEEINATIEVARKWLELRNPPEPILPGQSHKLILRLRGEWSEVLDESGVNRKENHFQLKGRHYASQLRKTSPKFRDYYNNLPGFFWFDQFRNLASPPIESKDEENAGQVSYKIGVARLRRHLNNWKLNQLAGVRGGPDWLLELENSFKRIFPGRSFHGLEPMYKSGQPAPEDYYFTLSDGSYSYDLEEMSGGEQSGFPI